MRHLGRTLSVLVTGTVLAAGMLVACDDHTAMRIPPGAQQVRLDGTHFALRLDPPTVRAGVIYFVIDGRPVLFIQHAAAVQGEQSGPMSEDELARLAQEGDTYHTSVSGGMGNVFKLTLAAGKYAFLATSKGGGLNPLGVRNDLCSRDPAACAALPPLPVAVLEVLP